MNDTPEGGDAPAELLIAAAMPAGHPASGHEALAACPNCGTRFDTSHASPNFCPTCGQAAVLHPPSVGEFLHEFVGHYIALEGPLVRTLMLLLTRPGELTREYLRGRRRRYVLPLRLYLSASFLFFLAFKLLPTQEVVRTVDLNAADPAAAASEALAGTDADDDDREQLRAALQAASAAASRRHAARAASGPASGGASGASAASDTPGEAFRCDPGSTVCLWMKHSIEEAARRWQDDPKAARASFKAHWLAAAPYAVFLMQPIYAAVVQLAYLRRRMRFGEHVVFSMHLHAFWFLAGLAALLLPSAASDWLMLGVCVYTVLALRRVYGGGWPATLARSAFIGLTYVILLGFVTGAISVMAALH